MKSKPGEPNKGTVPTVLPAPEHRATPAWLTYLRKVGSISAVRPVDPARRLLLGLPTAEYAAAAVALGGVSALATIRRTQRLCVPDESYVGGRVSAFVNGAYVDTNLTSTHAASATVSGNVTMTTYADIIRPLPSEFPEDRKRRKLTTEGPVLTAWATAGLAGANAARLHARCAATPVVVIGQHRRLEEDLWALEAAWPSARFFADLGRGLERWFRHPVVVCDPKTAVEPWLWSVTPALVVCDGAAAWRSPLRRAFPSAPHVLVTDRRSPAALDLVDEICAANPQTLQCAPEPLPGIEMWRIAETVQPRPSPGPSWDEDLI